jgi:hypothetical protein
MWVPGFSNSASMHGDENRISGKLGSPAALKTNGLGKTARKIAASLTFRDGGASFKNSGM